MFTTLRTLFRGADARAEEQMRSRYAVELIDQKIREAQTGLTAAKATLATLIQRERIEARQISALTSRAGDLSARAKEALAAGREALATEAAEAIAVMENELALRRETVERLAVRILRLRGSVEATHRRIVELKQNAISARAVHQEYAIQSRLTATVTGDNPIAEAEELIASVLSREDPHEQGEILRDIDRNLDRADLGDRMAAEGFGKATRTTAADVLAQLRAED
jgi:phage shock protein A